MTDIIDIEKGECVVAEVVWQDEDGNPIDLTGMELSIPYASPESLKDGTFSIVDAVNGIAELRIDHPLAADLMMGQSNWVRLQIKPPGGCPDVTPGIWIRVS